MANTPPKNWMWGGGPAAPPEVAGPPQAPTLPGPLSPPTTTFNMIPIQSDDEKKKKEGKVVVGTPQVVNPETPPPPTSVNQNGQPRSATTGPVSVGIVKQIGADTDEQLKAADQEETARTAYASDVSGAQTQQASEERGNALESEAQAKANADEGRNKIAEIGQLVADYRNEKIDRNQWWGEMNVGQKIGAVVGAMFAGLGGGPKMAMEYVNNLMDRNLARQQEMIKRHGASIAEANNLLYGFLKNSNNEQEAFDKARAAMTNAAMVDVEKAATAAQGPIQVAQIEELKAALKQQRDMFLAKLQATGGHGGAVNPAGLQVEGKEVFTDPSTGQQYVSTNPANTQHIQGALTAINNLQNLLNKGEQLLNQRGAWDYNPIIDTDNIRTGDTIDKEFLSNWQDISRLPLRNGQIVKLLRNSVPMFGSRFAGLDRAKLNEMRQDLAAAKDSLVTGAGFPANITVGGGSGKNAGKLTYYAQPGNPQAPQVHPEAKKPPIPSPGFQPNQ